MTQRHEDLPEWVLTEGARDHSLDVLEVLIRHDVALDAFDGCDGLTSHRLRYHSSLGRRSSRRDQLRHEIFL